MIEIRPLSHCDALITIPGSKSYTHRALIIAGLAEGESVIESALQCDDTDYTLKGLRELGVRISGEPKALRIQGSGGRLRAVDSEIYIGNSGTSMRFLTALAALKKGRTLLDGTARMRKRPMGGLLEGLAGLGVRAYSKEKEGFPPVIVDSEGLRGGPVTIGGSESSQYVSALLMVAPYAREDVRIKVRGHLASKPYVDITKDVMAAFGVEVHEEEGLSFFVRAGKGYQARRYAVEGDASNASYFLAAAAITQGRVRVKNFRPRSIQGDRRFLEILEAMGCGVSRGEDWAEVCGRKLQGMEIDMNTMPDLVPTLAVSAIFAQGRTLIRNIGHLRGKESDRIGDLAAEMRKLGVKVEDGNDWLAIEGGKAHGAVIDPHEDHRLAMSFAIAGLALPGMKILEERCVNKSFPEFWETLEKLY